MSYGQEVKVSMPMYAADSDERQMKSSKPKKKIGFIKRWMLNSVKSALEDERQKEAQELEAVQSIASRSLRLNPISSPSLDSTDRALHFTVYNASGGRIVETRKYDSKRDRNNTSLYVITSDQDFGKEIDKIITMETLKS